MAMYVRHFCAMRLHLRQDSIRQLLSILEYPLKFVFFDCLPYLVYHCADIENPILTDFTDLFFVELVSKNTKQFIDQLYGHIRQKFKTNTEPFINLAMSNNC